MPNTKKNIWSPDFTTPVMEAGWTYLRRPDTAFGERWYIQVKVDTEDPHTVPMLAWLTEQENTLRIANGLKPVKTTSLLKKQAAKDGYEAYEYLTFKSTSPDWFTIEGTDGEIYRGSKVQVKGSIQYYSAGPNKGVVLRPKTVILIEAKPYSGGGVDFSKLPDEVDLSEGEAEQVEVDLDI